MALSIMLDQGWFARNIVERFCHGAWILEKSEISWEVGAPGRFRALSRSGVLAGAFLIACGAAARLGAGAAAAPE